MTRTELIAALEAAEGPSRKLDGKIAETLGWLWLEPAITGPGGWFPPEGGTSEPVPSYTESIDAALSFTPEGEWFCISGPHSVAGGKYDGGPKRYDAVFQGGIEGLAATPAIALCIANLRALEAQEETNG